MDSINQLAAAIGSGVARARTQAKTATGIYSGGAVRVNGGGYRPINAGDTLPADGKPVLCIVDGNNCFVVCDK